MGLTIDYFYSLTPRQFSNALTGFRRGQENAYKTSWEQTRRVMWAMLRPYQAKGALFTDQNIMEFPWEVKTPEEIAQIESERLKNLKEGFDKWAKIDAAKASGKLITKHL